MARPAVGAGRQAPGAGLLLTLGAAACAACANVEPPPGGPPDTQPPALLRVVPESGAVLPALRGAAVLQFDEVIEEMPAAAGGFGASGPAAGLAGLILLSPVTGDVNVSWRRTAIGVEPDEGWKPSRVYRLELLPGVRDLRGNRRDAGRVVVFSTGPPIPTAALSGTALNWTEQRPLVAGLVRAAPRGDSTGYLAPLDSAGRFRLAAIPPGNYMVTALHDQNGNRQLDRREAYDSAPVRVDSTAVVVLWAFVHDTAGPRVRVAEPVDSITLRLVFSQHLDPADRPDTGRIQVLALPDSTAISVAAALWPPQYDSLVARERAAADTARRARPDTAPARPAPPRPEPRPAPPQAPPPGARGAAARGAAAAAGPPDTTALRRLLAQRPVPYDKLVVRVARPLSPEAKYFIRVRGVRNLNGATADGQAVLTMPKARAAPAARDTTRAPRDTNP